jgi:hypothetical protein
VLEGRTIDQVEQFDLLEFQQRARETCCPQKLFQLWEDICRRYERHEIGRYQLEEMKDVIWPNLKALTTLRRCVNDIPPASRENHGIARQSA